MDGLIGENCISALYLVIFMSMKHCEILNQI
jgi:hypothetical protein